MIRFGLRSLPLRPSLRIGLSGRTSLETGVKPLVRMFLNDRDLGTYRLGDDGDALDIALEPEDLSGKAVWLRLEASHAEAVYDEHHAIVDNRLLGVAVHELGILDRPAAAAELIDEAEPAEEDYPLFAAETFEPAPDDRTCPNEEAE